MILEVSRKQDYIFSRKELKENAARSAVIRHVTDSAFFRETAGELYREEENLVYSGGGHTVLQFADRQQATAFASRVTREAMKRYGGLELFVKQLEYDEGKTPGENLLALSQALERKKSLRRTSFRRTALGVEILQEKTHRPEPENQQKLERPEQLPPPDGWSYPVDFEELAGEDNFIAVVHADGNAMGKRVNHIYESGSDDWTDCCARLRRFSEGIQHDFETAFTRMAEEIVRIKGTELEGRKLPVRPIILAGDDVCFAARGKLGMECARIFLEQLTHMSNGEDGQPYSACAGVVMVHTKFPFHKAYDMAEELCSNAKRFGSELEPDGRISAMDWHIEFGQLQDSLSRQREDYETEDGARLELRPVTVVMPEHVTLPEDELAFRSYDFFRAMCRAMRGEYGKIARSKIKELRTAMKQGRVETEFFLHDKEVSDLLYHGFDSRYQDNGARWERYRAMLHDGEKLDKRPFRTIAGTERCLFFDAVELIDHCEFLKEAEQ